METIEHVVSEERRMISTLKLSQDGNSSMIFKCIGICTLLLILVFVMSGATSLAAIQSGDISQQIELFKGKSANGDNVARIELARYYLAVDNEKRDPKRAAKLLRQVMVDSGRDQGEHILPAMLLLQELGSEIRMEFPDISDVEYENAHRSVGAALFAKNDKRSVDVLMREASLLNAFAQITLNILYKYPVQGYLQYDPRILTLYKELAAEGLPRWQFYLGEIFLKGLGVKADPEKGIQYLEDAGLDDSHMMLADYYYLQNNDLKAEQYYKMAAEKDVPEAVYNLGVYAQKKKEYTEAAGYFKKALELEPDYNAARLELGRMYIHGWGLSRQERTGFQMMKDVADKEEEDRRLGAVAAINVAFSYLRGQGVQESRLKAKRYLQQAIESGDEKIINFLESLVESKSQYARFISEGLKEEVQGAAVKLLQGDTMQK